MCTKTELTTVVVRQRSEKDRERAREGTVVAAASAKDQTHFSSRLVALHTGQRTKKIWLQSISRFHKGEKQTRTQPHRCDINTVVALPTPCILPLQPRIHSLCSAITWATQHTEHQTRLNVRLRFDKQPISTENRCKSPRHRQCN